MEKHSFSKNKAHGQSSNHHYMIAEYESDKYLERCDNNKHKSKGTRGGKVLVTVNCNGSNIGNGVGIGNGNLNGGGGGNGNSSGGGATGSTCGTTGSTGPSMCNTVCEWVFLEQNANPTFITDVGKTIVWYLKATNISGKDIPGPLVITSSYFGTVFLTDIPIVSGATFDKSVTTVVTEKDIQQSVITSAAFVSKGVATGVPDKFTPGDRVSPVVVTKVNVNPPALNINGTASVVDGDIKLSLSITNSGKIDIDKFELGLTDLFGTCIPILSANPDNLFIIKNGILSLNDGDSIINNKTYNLIINTSLHHECPYAFSYDQYILNYKEKPVRGSTLVRSIAVNLTK